MALTNVWPPRPEKNIFLIRDAEYFDLSINIIHVNTFSTVLCLNWPVRSILQPTANHFFHTFLRQEVENLILTTNTIAVHRKKFFI